MVIRRITKEDKRKVAHLLKNIQVPENANKQVYGANLLHNLVDRQVKEDMNKQMNDVMGLNKPNQNTSYDPRKISQEYDLEYGTDTVEIHRDAISHGQKVLVIDDLIATGGTAQASCKLIEKLGGQIIECAFVIDLPDLKGEEKL